MKDNDYLKKETLSIQTKQYKYDKLQPNNKVFIMMSLSTEIIVDCENVIGELKHIWTSIGFDEINWCYTERGKDLLRIYKRYTEFSIIFRSRNNNYFLRESSTNCLVASRKQNSLR